MEQTVAVISKNDHAPSLTGHVVTFLNRESNWIETGACVKLVYEIDCIYFCQQFM